MRYLAFLFVLITLTGWAQQTRPAKVPLSFSVMTKGADPNEPVHLFLKGEAAELKTLVEQWGGHFKYAFKDYVAVILPVSAVPQLEQASQVKAVHFEFGKGQPLLNHSRLQTGIKDVHDGTAGLPSVYTGQDVIIGVIDAGIDLEHPDFQNEDGSTRVLELWDQTMSVSSRTPSYGYGQVWDSAEINAGICPHEDQAAQYGHGTNTAGIAAGNGQSNEEFTGCAPDADIIIVSSNFSSFSWTSTVADAVDYIFDRAEAYGKPCVINASIGNYSGSHDARDVPTQFIESTIEETSGRAMVCAAGNSGEVDPYHLGYEATSDTTFTWFQTASNANIGSGIIFFEVYGDVDDFETVQFAIGADKTSPSYTFRGGIDFDSILNKLNIVYTEDLFSASGNFLGNVQTWADSTNGTYRLQVYLNDIDSIQYNYRLMITGSGRLDCWSGPLTGTASMVFENLPTGTEFPDIANIRLPDGEQTIVSNWACSEKVITTGNYTNRTEYNDVDGQLVTFSNLTQGDIAASSSAGPSRLGVLKPDIAAPGELTLAPGAAFQIAAQLANSSQRERVATGGMHHRAGGTSSASPVVAAVAAMFLEKCPDASWSDFKEALIAGAGEDQYTLDTPNYTWGNGKVDAVQTLRYHTPRPALISDGNEFCDGGSLQITIDGSYPSILWASGETTSSITATQSGLYYAELYSSLGCQGYSDTLVVIERSKPEKPTIELDGDLIFCANESVELSIPDVYGAYEWSTGHHTANVTITDSGTFYCRVSNAYDCENYSDTIALSKYPGRESPVLHFQEGDVLQLLHDSLPVESYRWYVNGELDEMLVDSAIAVSGTGYYQASFVDSNGCEWKSDEVNVYALTAGQVSQGSVHVYPTPFERMIRVRGLQGAFHWEVRDISGRMVKQGAGQGTGMAIDAADLPRGQYVLLLMDDLGSHQKLLIKL